MTTNIKHRPGFTIVELLIVIVVIAILAAITIVAYNGVSRRADESVLMSDLQQASRQVAVSQTTSGALPDTLSDVAGGVKVSEGTLLQYTKYTPSVTVETYCITASRKNMDFMLNSVDGQLTAGVCPDDISINDMPTVTNLSANPSVEVDETNWTDSRSTCTRTTDSAKEGNYGMHCVVDGTGYFPRVVGTTVSATSGTVYTVSAWVKSTAQVRIGYDRNSGGFQVLGPLVTSNGNWVRLSITTATTPAGTTAVKSWVGVADNTPNGTPFQVDGIMITEGPTQYGYADGESPLWTWNGTPGLSSSSGLLAP